MNFPQVDFYTTDRSLNTKSITENIQLKHTNTREKFYAFLHVNSYAEWLLSEDKMCGFEQVSVFKGISLWISEGLLCVCEIPSFINGERHHPCIYFSRFHKESIYIFSSC